MKALQAITDLFKSLIVDSKNLSVWAEDGALFCTQNNDVDGFDLEYTVNVMCSDVELDPSVVFMHLVCWLNQYDIDRAEKGLSMPTFAVEILDAGRCDLKIKIDIREEYQLEFDENGAWKQHGNRYTCKSTFEKSVWSELDWFDDAILINPDLSCPHAES